MSQGKEDIRWIEFKDEEEKSRLRQGREEVSRQSGIRKRNLRLNQNRNLECVEVLFLLLSLGLPLIDTA